MTIREQLEQLERQDLSPLASLSADSRGRDHPTEPCPIRTAYQRDRDRIIHSKSFRRLKHKTQVFLSPEGDHYRTRLTHTLEVSQIGRTIARALRLNEDLVEAAAMGHDIGHTPFGHAGEYALREVCGLGFDHNEQSVRVVERLENDGKGLNLTWEVRDAIRCTPPAAVRRRRWKAGCCGTPTRSPTSTTTSRTPSGPECSGRRTSPGTSSMYWAAPSRTASPLLS